MFDLPLKKTHPLIAAFLDLRQYGYLFPFLLKDSLFAGQQSTKLNSGQRFAVDFADVHPAFLCAIKAVSATQHVSAAVRAFAECGIVIILIHILDLLSKFLLIFLYGYDILTKLVLREIGLHRVLYLFLSLFYIHTSSFLSISFIAQGGTSGLLYSSSINMNAASYSGFRAGNVPYPSVK